MQAPLLGQLVSADICVQALQLCTATCYCACVCVDEISNGLRLPSGACTFALGWPLQSKVSNSVATGERHRESVLQNIAANLDGWTVQTKQETAIYHTLNKLSVDTSRKVSCSALPLLKVCWAIASAEPTT